MYVRQLKIADCSYPSERLGQQSTERAEPRNFALVLLEKHSFPLNGRLLRMGSNVL